MKTLKFETNISCSGCKAKVTPFLDQAEGVCHWDVDLHDVQKVLSVEVDDMTEEEVMEVVGKSGFFAKPLND